MKFIMVVGLPGSGKTHFAKSLMNDDSFFIDDPKDFQKDVLDRINLTNSKRIIIADPWLCLETVRDKAIQLILTNYPNAEISWIFFENNYAACVANIIRRKLQNDHREIGSQLDFLQKNYKIPTSALTNAVYKPNQFKLGDRIFHKNFAVAGTVVGNYNDEITQVLFDDALADSPDMVDATDLTLIENPNDLLKNLV